MYVLLIKIKPLIKAAFPLEGKIVKSTYILKGPMHHPKAEVVNSLQMHEFTKHHAKARAGTVVCSPHSVQPQLVLCSSTETHFWAYMVQMDDILVPFFPYLLSYKSSFSAQRWEVLPQNMLLLKHSQMI